MAPIRVVIADDHTLVRAGIRALLQRLTGVQVVGEAGSGEEALALIMKHQPDLAILDIGMEPLNGLQVTARVKQELPLTRVIILSMHSSEEYVLKALQLGATGYLLKDSAKVELELAVRAVANGGTYLSPSISTYVISAYAQRTNSTRKRPGADPPLEQLTPRQREILRLIAVGHTSRGIAQHLDISVKTVEAHRSQITDRLDIHDLAGLVRYAIRMGLVNENV